MVGILRDLRKLVTPSKTFRIGFNKIKWISENPGTEDIGFPEDTVRFANLVVRVINKIGLTNLWAFAKSKFDANSDFSIEHALVVYLLSKYKNLDIKDDEETFCKYVEAFDDYLGNVDEMEHNIDIIKSIGWAEGAVELSNSKSGSYLYLYLKDQSESIDYVVSFIDLCNKEVGISA